MPSFNLSGFFLNKVNALLFGSFGDDEAKGSSANDLIFGIFGDDRLKGGKGDDVILGGFGDDRLSGGKGDDEIFGGLGDDRLKGGAGDDVLWGGIGDDRLDGGAGFDRLYGGAGDDRFRLTSIENGEVVDGGTDTNTGDATRRRDIRTGDTLDLAKLDLSGAESILVDLDLESQGALLPEPPSQNGILRVVQGGETIEITLTDIENIIGSDADETLFGNQENNVIRGGAGDDRIHPFGGVDFVDGGEGTDTLLLNGEPEGITIDFETGIAGTNTFVNFENANGSASGGDVILGDEGVNVLNGIGGDDVLNGRGGQDQLIGGDGADTFQFSGDAFNGVDVSAEGRQVAVLPDEIVDFAIAEDRFQVDGEDFSLELLTFANGLAAELSGDANVLVLQDSFANAGAAASAIAANDDLTADEGLFVYFNENLGINRLVYSNDLDDNGDISVLANLTNLEGDDALAALSTFTADNFDLI